MRMYFARLGSFAVASLEFATAICNEAAPTGAAACWEPVAMII
jgi:hypothetical protein